MKKIKNILKNVDPMLVWLYAYLTIMVILIVVLINVSVSNQKLCKALAEQSTTELIIYEELPEEQLTEEPETATDSDAIEEKESYWDISTEEATESVTTEAEPEISYEPTPEFTQTNTYAASTDDGVLTAYKGVNYNANGNRETYYNLPMQGVVNNAHNMGFEGEYWVREDGCKMFGDYIIVAANLYNYPRGSIVETSLGQGIVLDTGGFAESNPNQFDIATDW